MFFCFFFFFQAEDGIRDLTVTGVQTCALPISSLTTVGVLGDTVVDLNSQFAVGPQLQDGDELKTLETPSLTDVVKASQGTIEKNLNNGQGSIGKLMTDDTLYNRLNDAAGKLQSIANTLDKGQGTAGM